MTEHCGACEAPAFDQAPLELGWGEAGICAGCLLDVAADFPDLVHPSTADAARAELGREEH